MAHDMRDQDRLKIAIMERVMDLGAERHLGLAMILAGFDVLTGPHLDLPKDPAVLALIKENYPDATPALIRNRAVDEEGLVVALAAAETLARIYVDYSPLSHWASDKATDEQSRPSMSVDVENTLGKLSDDWLDRGASLFGITCTIILTATRDALRRGLPWPKAARICLDALKMIYTRPESLPDHALVTAFAETVGTSTREARKHIDRAKESSAASQDVRH